MSPTISNPIHAHHHHHHHREIEPEANSHSSGDEEEYEWVYYDVEECASCESSSDGMPGMNAIG